MVNDGGYNETTIQIIKVKGFEFVGGLLCIETIGVECEG